MADQVQPVVWGSRPMMRPLLLAMAALVFLLVRCAPADESVTATTLATPTRAVLATPTAATTPVPLSTPALKYRLLDEFPDFFFCDPDYYPIGRDNEQELALERFPAIEADAVEFEAIIGRLGLPHDNLTSEEKLQVYREHKKLAALFLEPLEGGFGFDIAVSADGSTGQTVQGTIDRAGDIEVTKRDSTFVTCPICLTRGTLIDAPGGPVPVEELKPRDAVWTADSEGRRVAGTVAAVSATRAAPGHTVVRVELDDGRSVTVSPGHPAADGRRIGQLRPGDTLDGARVVTVKTLPYDGGETFDLLPRGDTGRYWANGVLLGSTLKPD